MITTPCALVKRSPSGSTDSMGNDIDTETVTMTAGVFAPGSSTEIQQGSDTVTTQPTEYLPADVTVDAYSVLIPDVVVDASGNPVLDGNGKVQGTRYEVDGEPENWPASPFSGWRPDLPVVVRLRRVTG